MLREFYKICIINVATPEHNSIKFHNKILSHFWTRSLAIADRPRDASCHSVFR